MAIGRKILFKICRAQIAICAPQIVTNLVDGKVCFGWAIIYEDRHILSLYGKGHFVIVNAVLEGITGFLILSGYKLTVTHTSTGQSNKQLPLGAVLSRLQ